MLLYIIRLRNEYSENLNKVEVIMGLNINVREFLGENHSIEDAIILRDTINKNISNGVVLDFDGLNRVSTAFLTTLFNDLIMRFGREHIFSKINVKNISNYNDYSRVVLGTAF